MQFLIVLNALGAYFHQNIAPFIAKIMVYSFKSLRGTYKCGTFSRSPKTKHFQNENGT